jgi:NAD(P)H-dependent FMN reductase
MSVYRTFLSCLNVLATVARVDPRVVAICGSLRDGSRTRVALRAALSASREAGATTELVDLREYELPRLNAVDGDVPDAHALREAVEQADSVLLGTPNYHRSYSGALNNALDYCGRDEFGGTTVGLLEVAAGAFPWSALVHLRTVGRTLRAWTLPTETAIPRSSSVVGEDRITVPKIADRIHRLGRELARYAGVSGFPERTERMPASGDDSAATDRYRDR